MSIPPWVRAAVEHHAAGTDTHLPIAGTWTCGACPSAWPECPESRRQLRVEFAGRDAQLGAYMVQCLVEAGRDLPHAEPVTLYRRFLGWLVRLPAP